MWKSIVSAVLIAAVAGCEAPDAPEPRAERESGTNAAPRTGPTSAVATLRAKSGSELEGEAHFTEGDDGRVTLEVRITNVAAGRHGVHIHETGDCGTDDASSAGDHWNPGDQPHGRWGSETFHLGDIGNVEVGEDGGGSLSLTTDLWRLENGGERGVIGRAVVVHSGADDFVTQPDGAAGERIGCGVIERDSST